MFVGKLFAALVCLFCSSLATGINQGTDGDVLRRMATLEALFSQQQLRIESLESDNARLRQEIKQANLHFAFSAYATVFGEYETGERIIFDGIISNIGPHYDPVLSEFVCPVSGTYYFVINMQSGTNGYMVRAELMLDDVMVANAEVYDVSTYAHMSSNSVVISCALSQKVWVRAGARSEVHGEDEPYTTFSGFLIEYD